MNWEHERSKLLPRSGLGVVDRWLVIAPPGNPVVRVDLRGLDQIRVQTDEDFDSDDDAPATGSDNDPRQNLILGCGELEIAVYVADGSEAVEQLVREASPHTRGARGVDGAADVSRLLMIGDDAVRQLGELLQVGSLEFRISDVRDYALRGANIPLGGGAVLQAAVALLVVAAAERDAEAASRSSSLENSGLANEFRESAEHECDANADREDEH